MKLKQTPVYCAVKFIHYVEGDKKVCKSITLEYQDLNEVMDEITEIISTIEPDFTIVKTLDNGKGVYKSCQVLLQYRQGSKSHGKSKNKTFHGHDYENVYNLIIQKLNNELKQ